MMESMLVSLLLLLAASATQAQAQFSYFNIHRTELAPLPTRAARSTLRLQRPFALDPLLGTPPTTSSAESATQSSVPTSQANPNSQTVGTTPRFPINPTTQTVGQTPRFPANNFYFNSFANQHAGRLNPFLFPGAIGPPAATPESSTPAPTIQGPQLPNSLYFNSFAHHHASRLNPFLFPGLGPQLSHPGVVAPAAATPAPTTESSTPAPNSQEPQLPNSFYFNSFDPQSLGRLHPFLLPGLGLPSLPTLPGTSSINNTADNATVVNSTLPQPLPGSFYFNSFAPQNVNPLHPFLLSGLPSMTPTRPRAAAPSSYLPNFPHHLFDNNFPNPYTNYGQVPQPSSYFRGPHGHYQISGSNRFDYSPFNGFQSPFMPQPVIYQIIYYQLPAGNGTAGNGTTTTGPEVTTESPTSTTSRASTNVVVEIPTVPSTSTRVVEEVTTRAATTTASATTTTTMAPTTTSTENTTEK